MTEIRAETARDHRAIKEVNSLAFGREDESRLIDALRRTDAFVPDLSLVAVRDGVVVGHILFTKISIRTPTGAVPALSLAPMAVRPELQRRSIGTALARQGLEEARRLGHRIVVVVGHPGYYPRFGFEPAAEKGIKAPFDVPREAFLVLELVPGALDGVSGVVEYPPPFLDVSE